MRKAFNLRPVQTRSSVSRSSGTYMKMLAPFGLKYYRPQCMFLPRNLCIMRGEIDYVASNRSIDPPGVRHPSDGMSDIWHRVDGRNWTRPDAPFLGADFRIGSNSEVELADADFRFAPESGLKSDIGPCPFRANKRHQLEMKEAAN